MTESEWETCEDANVMLSWMGDKISDRKMRLFGCASFAVSDPNSKDDLLKASLSYEEKFADGSITSEQAEEHLGMNTRFDLFEPVSHYQVSTRPTEYRAQCVGEILRDCAMNAHEEATKFAMAIWKEKFWDEAESDYGEALRCVDEPDYRFDMPRDERNAWSHLLNYMGWNKTRSGSGFDWDYLYEVKWEIVFEKQWKAHGWHTAWDDYYQWLCREDDSFELAWDCVQSNAAERGWSGKEVSWGEILEFSEELALSVEQALQPAILRHIVGNPFNEHSVPSTWPPNVIKWAEALNQGENCAQQLSNALRLAGETYAHVVEHFHWETNSFVVTPFLLGNRFSPRNHWHPKGCYWLDLILGKEKSRT